MDPVEESLPETVEHGPASQQTRVLERTLRRWWLPVARNWRLTPRGIRLLQRITDPTDRVPVLRGTRVEPTRIGGRPAEWVRAPRALAQAHGGDAGHGRDGDDGGHGRDGGDAGHGRDGGDGGHGGTDAAGPMLLYLHGGGYVFGSPRTHRNLVSRISHVTGLPALSLDYRLPPEATLPAPIEDALAAYRELLAGGRDPRTIVVAGDSAGGNLALALSLHAAEEGLPQPAALVLLSPWADLTQSGASAQTNDLLDPFIPPGVLDRFARVAAGGADPAGWRISPLLAPEELWRALPPTHVQAGSTERLLDDGVAVARRVAASCTRAELHVFDRQPHVVPLWNGTPEARTALREMGRFVTSALAPESAPAAPSEADAEAASEVAEPADLS